MRPIRVLLLTAALLSLAACAGERPGWTYAPAPSPTVIPSVEPSGSTEPGGSDTPSAPPSGSAGPSASVTPSGEPAPSVAPGDTALQLAAQNIAWSTTELDAPADTPFQIIFANNDASVPHDVDLHEGDPTGPVVFDSEPFPGVETRTLDVGALPGGIYAFVCSIHPNMVGSLTVE